MLTCIKYQKKKREAKIQKNIKISEEKCFEIISKIRVSEDQVRILLNETREK